MSDATAEVARPAVVKVVSLGKDIVALLRDATLFVLAMLLLAFPAQFNTILVDAGFEEGSVVGFKWKSKLIDSNQALEEARSTIASLQTRNDELLKALQYAKAKSDDPELMKRVTALQEENRKLQDQTQRVQTVVADTIESNAPLVQKAISAAEQRAAPATLGKSAYTVGLQTLGVDDSERVAINQKVQADGYGLDPLTYSYPAGQRPDWFAPHSTVFYYANAARPMAEQLAGFMRATTGQQFAVQRGAGLGVDPSKRNVTLFVHYAKR